MVKVVGIGEYAISNNGTDKLKTYALASCVAVTVHSPLKKAAGMIHIALPSPSDIEDCKNRPGYFATTGVPLLIHKLCSEFGILKEGLRIHIYGGADSLNANDIFNIGKRNIEAVTQILSDLALKIHKADVGGFRSRTIEIDVDTGEVKVVYQPIRI